MEKLRNRVRFVPIEDLPKALTEAAESFEKRAEELWSKIELQEAARVFPNILRTIGRQLRILAGSIKLPIEVAAGACRTVFEINIRVRLITQDPKLIKEFWVERVFEEVSLLKSFKRLADCDADPSVLKPIDSRIEELTQYIQKWQLSKPTVDSIVKQAEMAGCVEEYKSLYGFYSKYTHGSAWLINSKEEERDGEGYRNILAVQTQLYAYDSLGRIDDFVEHRQKEA